MLRFRWLAAISLAVLISGAGAAAAASVQISINKLSQKMTVTIDGVERYVWLVSTGAPGYSTPSGSYRPFRMEPDHYSKEWDDAPMPHSIFFTPAGHAIHGSPHTRSLGRRASHGCVRLAPDNAAKLYALVQRAGMSNTRVIVKGGFDFGFLSEFSAPQIRKPSWLRRFDPARDLFRR
jgi:lipoprotein-anchoring transpeptidase ErfK/SrfK